MSTYRQMCLEGEKKLRDSRIEEWKLDAWLLAESAFGISRAWYFAHGEEEAPPEQIQKYREWIEKRSDHIPLQHLTGQAFFMGMEFSVDERVLIPRQDTEILVETALEKIKEPIRLLDMCTGSGCILLSILYLAKERGISCQGIGADISAEALEVAEKNRQKYRLDARLVESNLYEKLEGDFDMLVSNPPYIPTGEIEELMEEVRNHDPILALDGREDGLYFYREIIKDAHRYLKPEGWILLEIGCRQAGEVMKLLTEHGFTEISVKKDLAGLDRVVTGRRKAIRKQEEEHV